MTIPTDEEIIQAGKFALQSAKTFKEQVTLEGQIKVIISAIRPLIEAQMADKWQPIETAPKQITRILACDGEEIQVIEWGENWCSHGCYIPTHWMPLPKPPQT